MLKHITPKDLVEFLGFGLGFVVLIILAGSLEAAPLGIAILFAIVAAFVLWVVWAIIVIRDRKGSAGKTLWVSDGTQWIAADGSGRTRPFNTRTGVLFDQDEDAVKHLDFTPDGKDVA